MGYERPFAMYLLKIAAALAFTLAMRLVRILRTFIHQIALAGILLSIPRICPSLRFIVATAAQFMAATARATTSRPVRLLCGTVTPSTAAAIQSGV